MASSKTPIKDVSEKNLEKEASEDNPLEDSSGKYSGDTSEYTLENISEPGPENISEINPEDTSEEIEQNYENYLESTAEPALNARLFAEELVEFILQKFGYSWGFNSKIRKIPRNVVQRRFLKEVGEAVFDIFSCHIEEISKAYRNLQEKDVTEMKAFRRQLCITGASYLKKNNYDHINFLVMAASFTGVAVFYFQKGNDKMVLATVQVLAYFLNYLICDGMFNVKDWFELAEHAQDIRCRLVDSKTMSNYAFPSFSVGEI